jgi:hypothetical protein
MSIHDAITEMWERIRPLELKGYNPVSVVEVIDNKTKEIIQTFQLTDPEFQLHLKSDEKEQHEKDTHLPEKKEHYRYMARIQLAS